ncbi:DUF397 domain-containing protein [Nocardia seriolae]|uniref:DUF397 domain-containing protein n=1 Tax=Nocardia seriolae TaxID=37332 RepID=UPI003365B00B
MEPREDLRLLVLGDHLLSHEHLQRARVPEHPPAPTRPLRRILGPAPIPALRDTKDRSKPAHEYTAAEWQAFILGVKSGEFDL